MGDRNTPNFHFLLKVNKSCFLLHQDVIIIKNGMMEVPLGNQIETMRIPEIIGREKANVISMTRRIDRTEFEWKDDPLVILVIEIMNQDILTENRVYQNDTWNLGKN